MEGIHTYVPFAQKAAFTVARVTLCCFFDFTVKFGSVPYGPYTECNVSNLWFPMQPVLKGRMCCWFVTGTWPVSPHFIACYNLDTFLQVVIANSRCHHVNLTWCAQSVCECESTYMVNADRLGSCRQRPRTIQQNRKHTCYYLCLSKYWMEHFFHRNCSETEQCKE